MPQLEGSLCPGRLGPIRRFRTARDRSATVPATARPSLSSWGAAKSMRAISVETRALPSRGLAGPRVVYDVVGLLASLRKLL